MSRYPYKSSHIDYFQIGAHIGNTHNDPIYFQEMKQKNLILIEPVPFLYDILKNNYKDRMQQNEIEFLNVAVSDHDGMISLMAPSKDNDFQKHPFFLNQMASTTDKYIKYFDFKQRFPDFKFETIHVQCRSLNTIIKERGIQSIDHMIIDTEGHDYTILVNFDLNLVKPKKITFENCYMDDILPPEGQMIRVNRPNYNKIITHFKSHGYEILSENNEDTTVILP